MRQEGTGYQAATPGGAGPNGMPGALIVGSLLSALWAVLVVRVSWVFLGAQNLITGSLFGELEPGSVKKFYLFLLLFTLFWAGLTLPTIIRGGWGRRGLMKKPTEVTLKKMKGWALLIVVALSPVSALLVLGWTSFEVKREDLDPFHVWLVGLVYALLCLLLLFLPEIPTASREGPEEGGGQ